MQQRAASAGGHKMY